jgi:hypothetical protein
METLRRGQAVFCRDTFQVSDADARYVGTQIDEFGRASSRHATGRSRWVRASDAKRCTTLASDGDRMLHGRG